MHRTLLFTCLALVSCDEDPTAPTPGEFPDRSLCTFAWSEDWQADGDDDYWETTTYDERERIATSLVEQAPDWSYAQAYTYDDNDCLVAWQATNLDGDWNYTWDATFTCDAHGYPTGGGYDYAVEEGGELRGTSHYDISYDTTYEGEHPVRVVTITTASDGSVTSEITEILAWQDDQAVRSELWSFGVLDTTETWAYDDAGDLARERTIWAYSGAEEGSIYSRDDWGRIVHRVDYGTTHGDHTLWNYVWDPEIYLLQRVGGDADGDGTEDLVESYACTSEGWPWSCDITRDGDLSGDNPPNGQADRTYSFSYTCP